MDTRTLHDPVRGVKRTRRISVIVVADEERIGANLDGLWWLLYALPEGQARDEVRRAISAHEGWLLTRRGQIRATERLRRQQEGRVEASIVSTMPAAPRRTGARRTRHRRGPPGNGDPEPSPSLALRGAA